MGKLICAAALAAAWGGAACAQEFKGAEVSAELLSFSEGDDASQTTYRGSAEVGVFGGFGVAADISYYDFGDEGLRNVTVHALYDALEFATVGAFYARDSDDEFSADVYGVEAGRSFGRVGVEGFLGFVNDEGADYRILGLDGTFDLGPRFSLTGTANLLDTDDGRVSRVAAGGEFRFGNGPVLFGELGRVSVSDDAVTFEEGAAYVGLGARIAIGPNDGTTFEARGIGETISGF